jgi:membrane-bound metal-dependent hydrolase YbcI (DUF457 family)
LAAITALGAAVLVSTPASVTFGTAVAVVLANQIGGIAPDIDQPTAPLWRNLPVGGMIGRVFDKLLGGHRFLSHSLLGFALFGVGAHFLLLFLHPLMPHLDSGYIWWAFMIGVASHLVMDTLTKEGVPWLLPIPAKFGLPPLKKLRITTGKAAELLLIFPALIAVDIYLYATHYHTFLALIHHLH